MYKLKIFFTLLLFGVYFVNCQEIHSIHEDKSHNLVECLLGFSDFRDDLNSNFIVKNILSKIGLENEFFITKTCKNLNNAYAVKLNGINYILIDPIWLDFFKTGKNDWFQLMVIGHEIGHHLLNHTEKKSYSNIDRQTQELEADEFSGYILGIYGMPEIELELIFDKFPEIESKLSTHPNKIDRYIALKNGYNKSLSNNQTLILKGILKETNFSLKYLIEYPNKARYHFHQYINFGKNEDLNLSSDYYKKTIRIYEDIDFIYEFAWLSLIQKNEEDFMKLLELCYLKSNDLNYIFDIFSFLIENNNNYDKINEYQEKYKEVLDEFIESKSYFQNLNLATLKFMSYITFSINDIENFYEYFNELESLAFLILDKYDNQYSLLSQNQINQKMEVLNTIGLIYLRLEDYEKAILYFEDSKKILDFSKKNNLLLDKLYGYNKINERVLMFNLLKCYFGINDFESVLNYSNLYLEICEPTSNYIGEVFLMKGIAYYNLNKIDLSLEILLLSENIDKFNGLINYYKALCFKKKNNNNEACIELFKACDKSHIKSCYLKNECL